MRHVLPRRTPRALSFLRNSYEYADNVNARWRPWHGFKRLLPPKYNLSVTSVLSVVNINGIDQKDVSMFGLFIVGRVLKISAFLCVLRGND